MPRTSFQRWLMGAGRLHGGCHWCGHPVRATDWQTSHERATRDHLTPRARGGTKGHGNIVLSCETCNLLKGDMTPGEFIFFLGTGVYAATYVAYLAASKLASVKPERIAAILHREEARKKESAEPVKAGAPQVDSGDVRPEFGETKA